MGLHRGQSCLLDRSETRLLSVALSFQSLHVGKRFVLIDVQGEDLISRKRETDAVTIPAIARQTA